MPLLAIVLLGVVAAVLYGIVHDQVTIRVCPEYFTVFHPHLVDTDSLTVLALAWGVAATWWVGLPLGLALALSARLGRRPQLTAEDLLAPVARLLGTMAACAVVAALLGYALAEAGAVRIVPSTLAERIPAERHTRFLADLWAHNASYLVGAVGGIVLAVRTWRRRGRLAAAAVPGVG